MTIPHVRHGDPLSAEQQNALISQVNAHAHPGTPGLSQYGTSGATFHAPPAARLGLFELTQKVWYPSDDDPPVPPGLSTVPDVPYTLAARCVWVDHPDNEYGETSRSPDVVLYQPTCLRDTDDTVWSTPSYGIGSRVYAAYNLPAGRWEIVQRPPYVARIEVRDGVVYMPGDASVDCHLADDPDEPIVTVYQPTTHHRFGIARGGSSTYSHAGAEGYAYWHPVRRRWELMVLGGKLLCEGVADDTIDVTSTGTVSLWWKDYATGNMADGGENVEALNWCGPKILYGDRVIVSYDRHEDRWTIVEQPGGVVVDDGVTVNPARTLDFVGAGVTVTLVGTETARMTIP